MKRYVVLVLWFLLQSQTTSFAMEMSPDAPSSGLAAVVLGVPTTNPPELTESEREQSKIIGRDVVCLCGGCPKHTITDCGCGWAHANQVAIQHAVKKGMSREEIVSGYRKAYGESVLAMLPNEGFAVMGWLVPYIVAISGLLVLSFVGFKLKKRPTQAEASVTAQSANAPNKNLEDRLKKELEDLD